jgi:ATP-dependent Clp protease adaptor protein ClpS
MAQRTTSQRAGVTGHVPLHRVTPSIAPARTPTSESDETTDLPWVVIVWDDPVNLMDYVVFVFQEVFGFGRKEARRLMLQVHNEGKSVVFSGQREQAELYVQRLHGYSLWATMERSR